MIFINRPKILANSQQAIQTFKMNFGHAIYNISHRERMEKGKIITKNFDHPKSIVQY